MKKILSCICVFACLLALSSCALLEPPAPEEFPAATEPPAEIIGYSKADASSELCGVWVSYTELSMKYEPIKGEAAFRAKAERIAADIAENGFNTVFLHVRPNSDSFYPSELFPWTSHLSGVQGVDPGYDALEIFCGLAKRYGLSVHAWINPFRVSTDPDVSLLSESNPARRILDDGDPENDARVIVIDDGIYYNPADSENHALIIAGIREIITGYDVAGVHIDDYFYPSQDEKIDEYQYREYLSRGGSLPLDEWRRSWVSSFVSAMYAAVKAVDPGLIVSVSPTGSIAMNRDRLYADVELWCAESGYCDLIIPQIYFGFQHGTLPFAETALRWSELVKSPDVKALYGLAAYKCGQEDAYAGAYASEWIDNSDLLSRQLALIRKLKRYDGFVLFSYSYAFGKSHTANGEQEMILLRDELK